MRKFSMILISLVMFFLFSTYAFATETTTITQNQTEAIEIVDYVPTTKVDEENSETSFGDAFKKALSSITTYISIAGFLLVGIFMIFLNQEIPKKIATLTPFILLVMLLLARLFVFLPHADISITIYIIAIYVTGIILYKKTLTSNIPIDDQSVTINSVEKRAVNALSRLLKGSHNSIKCIQIYSIEEEDYDSYTEFSINFIGGKVKPRFNVNALFASTMRIDNEYLEEIKGVKSLYTSLTSDGELSSDEQSMILGVINEKIIKLQDKLNRIPSANAVTSQDCYIARILLMYLSLYAAIKDHGSFIGLGTNSLGLNDSDLEYQLFDYKRTGILGPVLFERTPYVFSYMKSNEKNGRFYYTLSFGTTRKYVMTITLANKNNEVYISEELSNNIKSIKNELSNILESKALERDEKNDKNQK